MNHDVIRYLLEQAARRVLDARIEEQNACARLARAQQIVAALENELQMLKNVTEAAEGELRQYLEAYQANSGADADLEMIGRLVQVLVQQ